MAAFRTALTWLVTASYLFASTLSARLHDHHGCCGRSTATYHHNAVQGHCHHGHNHSGHHGRHVAATADRCQSGAVLRAPHICAVCEFLAQAPLAPPTVALVPNGQLPQAPVPYAVLPVEATPAGTHFPRGPPSLG